MEESISLYQEALELRPGSHPNRWNTLHGLACSLSQRFDSDGRSQDLDTAIAMLRESLDLLPEPHPKRQKLLELLADTLQKRSTRTGDRADNEAADTLIEEVCMLKSKQRAKLQTNTRV